MVPFSAPLLALKGLLSWLEHFRLFKVIHIRSKELAGLAVSLAVSFSIHGRPCNALPERMYEDEGTPRKRRFYNVGTPISVRGVMKIVQKYARIAGITKHFSCHSLRYTCGTYKAKMGFTGLQIKALFGHERAETSEIYVHTAAVLNRQLMMSTSL